MNYALALKAAYPSITTMGPISWGWCEYWYSPNDGCGVGPDREAHGNVPLSQWYVQQNYQYSQQHAGTRLVDVFDLHYYPQCDNCDSSAEDSTTAAVRLRSVKSLYDPTYLDESWIGTAINLIPNMTSLISQNAPGLGMLFSISEYNWGDDTIITGALAQAEVLGIFAKYGVDMAMRWTAPASGSVVEDAFKMYLNYDGTFAMQDGYSVEATSSNIDELAVYASVSTTSNRIHIMFISKDPSNPAVATINIAGLSTLTGVASTGTLFQISSTGMVLGSAGSVPLNSGSMTLTFPPYSATLMVIPYNGGFVGTTGTSGMANTVSNTGSAGTVGISGSTYGTSGTSTMQYTSTASSFSAPSSFFLPLVSVTALCVLRRVSL